VLLTTHPLLVPWSWKSRAIPLPIPLGHTGPVTGSLHLIYIYIYTHTHTNIYIYKRRTQVTKAQRWKRGIALLFFNLGARWMGQRHAPAALPPGKNRYPLHRRMGGPHGLFGRVRKISPSPGFDPRTVQPARSESLYRLSYPGHIYIYIYIISK